MSGTELVPLFLAALQVSVPTFSWVVLGVVLHRAGLLSDRLISGVSRLAFNVGLPPVSYTHLRAHETS